MIGEGPRPKHTIFLDSEKEAAQFDAAAHFDTPRELLDRSYNRLRTADLRTATISGAPKAVYTAARSASIAASAGKKRAADAATSASASAFASAPHHSGGSSSTSQPTKRAKGSDGLPQHPPAASPPARFMPPPVSKKTAKLAAKQLRKLAEDASATRQIAYKEMAEQMSRVDRLGLARQHLQLRRELCSKGARVKVKPASGSAPAVYAWKPQRKK